MGTPDFRGIVIILAGILSLLVFLAAVLLSIRKIANKKDKGKQFDLFGLGRINAWHLLAYCLSCPFILISYMLVCSIFGKFGIRSFSEFAFTATLFTGIFFLAYIAFFLLYVLCLAVRSIFFHNRQKGMAKRRQAKRNKR